MARLYYDRYSDTLDWANADGKTALHVAAQKGNEELVRVRQASSIKFIRIRAEVIFARCSVIWAPMLTLQITKETRRCISTSLTQHLEKEHYIYLFLVRA